MYLAWRKVVSLHSQSNCPAVLKPSQVALTALRLAACGRRKVAGEALSLTELDNTFNWLQFDVPSSFVRENDFDGYIVLLAAAFHFLCITFQHDDGRRSEDYFFTFPLRIPARAGEGLSQPGTRNSIDH